MKIKLRWKFIQKSNLNKFFKFYFWLIIFFHSTIFAGGGAGDISGGNYWEQYFKYRINLAAVTLKTLDEAFQNNYIKIDDKKYDTLLKDFLHGSNQSDETIDSKSYIHQFVSQFKNVQNECKPISTKNDIEFCSKLRKLFKIDKKKCQEVIKSQRDAVGNTQFIVLREEQLNSHWSREETVLNFNEDKGKNKFDVIFIHEFVQNCMGFVNEEKSRNISGLLLNLLDYIQDERFDLKNYTNTFSKIIAKGENISINPRKMVGEFGVKAMPQIKSQTSFCDGEKIYLVLPKIRVYDSKGVYDLLDKLKTSGDSIFESLTLGGTFEECDQKFNQWNSANHVYILESPVLNKDDSIPKSEKIVFID